MLSTLYAVLPGATGGFPQSLCCLELIPQSHLAPALEGLVCLECAFVEMSLPPTFVRIGQWRWQRELGTMHVSLLV